MRFSNETGELDKPENCMSYMLVGILGCMALTARPILEKMRIECDAVIAKGKLYMVDEAVRYGNRIECTLGLENGPELDAETKARIAELTKKHCSVSVTIAKNPEITLAME
jgi:uncharacterized OsmC-like protein